ncbi:MAG: hypothetical protein PHD26_08245 [Methanosarcinaceae archaeon]|nr:hypothetical protein [Methanosarcinaceae archaeon]
MEKELEKSKMNEKVINVKFTNEVEEVEADFLKFREEIGEM